MNRISNLWRRLTGGFDTRASQPTTPSWRGWIFPAMSLLAVGWFFMRVIPKPIRATYPCQQAAFPMASAFIVWLLGLKASTVAFLKLRARKLKRVSVAAGLVCLAALAVIGIGAAVKNAGPREAWVPRDAPNSPMGVAKGIFPGRVTWIRDTNATPWNGITNLENTVHWFDSGTGVNQAAVDKMTSRSLQALTGAQTDSEAWDKIFRYYNSTHGRGNAGYRAGEIIAIKPNCNNAYAGNCDDDNQIDASPQTILAMLRQLVNQAHVPQTNILVYEAVRYMHNHIIRPCRAEFPGVAWMDSKGTNGICEKVVWHKEAFAYSVTESNQCGTSVPEQVYRSTYIINMALMKGHPTTGVTLTAKNHYGSINNRDHKNFVNTWQHSMGTYNPFVDLIGTKQLGGKTILFMLDGLFGTRDANDCVVEQYAAWKNLFGGQWSSSIFMSLDPVAIDSVGVDFLRCEFGAGLNRIPGHDKDLDNYLHEAALADNPPSRTVYQPDGARLASLGVHEHWNNASDKKYSRNLSTDGKGIELLAIPASPAPVQRASK